MKKLLMLLFLMTISLGQSQTFPLDFSDSADLIPGVDGVTTSIVQDNSDSVLQIVGSTGTWDNCQVILAQNVDLSDNANNTITFRFKSTGASTSGQHLLKFEGGTGGAAAAEGFFNASGTEWQTITIDFGAGLGIYSKLVIFTDCGSASYGWSNDTSGTYLIDDIAGGTNVAPPVVSAPTVAAITPTVASEDVISVFSGAYTDVGVSTFKAGWSSASDLTTVNIDGNPTLKYSGLNYAGIDINGANLINATSMETFHIDMWTPDCTTFKVKLVDFGADGAYDGGDDKQHEISFTPSQNGWNSYDIALSDFTGLTTREHIAQLVLSASGGLVYVDNMYFWKLPAGSASYYVDADGDGYGAGTATISTTPIVGSVTNNTDCNDTNDAIYPGATEVADTVDNDCDGLIDEGFPPTIAAPTPPARNAWDVKSIFSGAYANIALDELPTGWSQTAIAPFSVESIAGNDTWKFGGEFLAMAKYSGDGLNLTDMTTMHIDYWTPDSNIIIAKIVNTVDGGDATTLLEDPTQTGSWRSRDIPMATFGGSINKSKITQILIDPQSGGSTVYIDNFYFYRPETGAPSPTIGALTVPAKVLGDASFDLTAPTSNSAGAFTFTSSNESVATISGSTVTIVGAGSAIITASQAAAGEYGAGSTEATLVVSLNVAAPTPTIPADRVLSIYSGAAGYGTLAGTTFNPNWGQATQYASVDVVGNPTLRYSNLNYQGIQLGSVLDINTYNSIHLDIYGAGTSSVDFTVINQAGGAGSPDVERLAKTAGITLNAGWNSVVIPVASLLSINPAFELNRVGQLSFAGSGTIYVDNIYFSKDAATAVAPTVEDIAFCKGFVSALTAVASGTNSLKWYTVPTGGTALPTAPIPTVTKTYYVAQVMSDGVISPRATLVATVVALPTEVLGAMTSTTLNTAPTATPGSFVAATTKVGQYVGTTTEISYRIPAFTGSGLSYFWTVPTGVTIVGSSDTNALTVHYNLVAPGAGDIGEIKVQAVNTNGCKGTAKLIKVSKVLPAAPSTITMTNAAIIVAEGKKAAAITTFAPYMGTNTELTLTAKPSLTATSYVWELPTGVTVTNGSATTVEGVTSSPSNVITVNFEGVNSLNTHNYSNTAAVPVSTNVLRIGVKARNGVGVSVTVNTALANSSPDFTPNSTSEAKLLTLTAIKPVAPTSLKMYNLAVSSTVAVTDVSKFINTGTELTLTAAASALASSYVWELPEGVNIVGGNPATNTIKVNFLNVPHENTAFSLVLGVRAVNGMGQSVKVGSTNPATILTVTAAPATAVSPPTGSLKICATAATSVTYTIAAVAKNALDYAIIVPDGCTITVGTVTSEYSSTIIPAVANTTFTVNYPTGFIVTTANPKKIIIASLNPVGFAEKFLTLTNTGAVCPAPRLSDVADDFNVTAYPNPSSDVFNIDVQSSDKGATGIQVYDMAGRLIESRQAKSNSVEVGKNYASGIYNVKVNKGAQVKTLRVIKK